MPSLTGYRWDQIEKHPSYQELDPASRKAMADRWLQDNPAGTSEAADDTRFSDYAKQFGAGVTDLVSLGGRALDVAGADRFGQAVERTADRASEALQSSTTPAYRRQASQPFIERSEDGGWSFGGGWNPAKIMGLVARSLPSTAAGMGGGLAIGAGLRAAVGASRMSMATATMIGSGLSEGALSGGQGAKDTYDTVMKAPEERLKELPEYQDALKNLGDPAKARKALAGDMAVKVGAALTLAGGAAGAPAGHVYGKMLQEGTGGVVKRTLKGAATEAMEEAPQSAMEQGAQNVVARKVIDPDTPLTKGMAEAVVGGMVAGAGMGGAFGAVTAKGGGTEGQRDKGTKAQPMGGPASEVDRIIQDRAAEARREMQARIEADTPAASAEEDETGGISPEARRRINQIRMEAMAAPETGPGEGPAPPQGWQAEAIARRAESEAAAAQQAEADTLTQAQEIVAAGRQSLDGAQVRENAIERAIAIGDDRQLKSLTDGRGPMGQFGAAYLRARDVMPAEEPAAVEPPVVETPQAVGPSPEEIRVEAAEGAAIEPAPEVEETRLPAAQAPKEGVRTVRGRIMQLGGLNLENFKGEGRDLEPGTRKAVIRKSGRSVDLIERTLKEEGWLAPDENLLDMLRDDPKETLRRGLLVDQDIDALRNKPEKERTAREKRILEEIDHAPEAPPEAIDSEVNAEDLPDGAEMDMITPDGKWDRYKVIEKDPFEVVLQDGETVRLGPMDRVQISGAEVAGKLSPAERAGAAERAKLQEMVMGAEPPEGRGLNPPASRGTPLKGAGEVGAGVEVQETPQAQAREPWEMTLDDYMAARREDVLSKYPNASERSIENTIKSSEPKWHKAVEAQAKKGRLPDEVLDYYAERFGQDTLARTFRGDKAPGAEGWTPPDVRYEVVENREKSVLDKERWERTWAEQRKEEVAGMSRRVSPKEYREMKQRHKAEIGKALYEGKDVPPEVLADYPDLKAPEGREMTPSARRGTPPPSKDVEKQEPRTATGRKRSSFADLFREAADEVEMESAGAPEGYVDYAFAGEKAKGADRAALDRAKAMAAEGADPEAVRRETGWFTGPDDRWRFEISDEAMTLRPRKRWMDRARSADEPVYLFEAMQHPTLFQNYPELKNVKVRINDDFNGARLRNGEISFPSTIGDEKLRQTLIHEIQHAIQTREDFAQGGNPETSPRTDEVMNRVNRKYQERQDAIRATPEYQQTVESELDRLWEERALGEASPRSGEPYTRDSPAYLQAARESADTIHGVDELEVERRRGVEAVAQDDDPLQPGYAGYRRLAGEVEARDAAARADMTGPERMAAAPYESQGIPTDEMDVRREEAAPFSVSPTSAGISEADVKKTFPTAKVEQQGDDWRVMFPRGDALRIRQVDHIAPDEAAFQAGYRRPLTPAEKRLGAAGQYKDGEIKISRQGDRWTLNHEAYHFLERRGFLTAAEQGAIDKAAGAKGDGEARARWVESELERREFDRHSGPVRRALQRIADLLDGLVNMVTATGRGVVRGMESGRVYTRDADADREKTKQVHDFSSTQVKIKGDAADAITDYGRRIPDKEIYTQKDDDSYGREDEPHITVRYGLATDDVQDVAPAFDDLGPIHATLGKVSIFEADKYDVVKVDVSGPDIRRANKAVGDTVDIPGETFKKYKPHATIAYVKKGEGEKYVGDDTFQGMNVVFDSVELTDRMGGTHEVALDTGTAESGALYSMPSTRAPFQKELDDLIGGPKSESKSIREAVKDAYQSTARNWRTKMFDRLDPIKREVGADIHRLFQMEAGAPALVESALEEGAKVEMIGEGKNRTPIVTKGGEAPLDWFKRRGDDGIAALYWGLARRAEALTAEDRENWLDADAIKRIDTAIGSTASTGEPLADVFREFQAFNDNILNFARVAGTLDAEGLKRFKESIYVPMYRAMEDPAKREEFLQAVGRGGKHIQDAFKKLEGGKAKIADPVGTVLRNWSSILTESVRNVSRQELVNKAQTMNALSRIEGPDGNRLPLIEQVTAAAALKFKGKTVSPNEAAPVVSYMEDGKRKHMKINDPELYAAVANLRKDAVDGTVMKVFGASKRMLTYGATLGAGFRIANPIRDTLHGAIVSKSLTPFTDLARGVVKVWRNDADYVAMKSGMAGFSGDYVKADDPKALQRYLDRVVDREGKSALDRILDKPKKLLHFWEKLGEAGENATRVRLYEKTYKAEIAAGRSEAEARSEAAFQARDFLDFSMSGDAAAVRFIIQSVPFTNARLQGLYKLGRAAGENPVSFGVKGGLLALASMGLWAMNKDREEWRQLEDWDKWQYYHFWVGDKHFRIPKPFEVGALFSTIPESIGEAASGNQEVEYVGRAFRDIAVNTLSINPTPQLVKPLYEVWANKSSFTGRPIVNQALQRLEPGAQAQPWTSETLQWMGQAFNVSPMKAEAILRGYTASIGTFALGLADPMFRWAGDFPTRPSRRIDDYPVVGRFMKEANKAPRNSAFSQEFYKLVDETNKLAATIKYYQATGDFEMARDMAEGNRAALGQRKAINRAKREASDINKRIRAVWRRREMSGEEKERVIDRLLEKREGIYRRAVK